MYPIRRIHSEMIVFLKSKNETALGTLAANPNCPTVVIRCPRVNEFREDVLVHARCVRVMNADMNGHR